ncbi:MAG: metallophosphoesterase [Myxococcales bacterium]|nr:metallophosphoesterase [Myxococcales bacterium]USN50615.1 MAG: metallophosphoesterase [Myxococcales bacterium]
MKVFGISDLHLSFSSDKPMDIFGDHWRNHADRMADEWDRLIQDDDVVLCPGDLSWAMKLSEAQADLDWIAARPGLKILVKGNHDLWWSAIGKVRSALHPSCVALQNDAYDIGPFVIAGSRCWTAPGSFDYTEHDEKIYLREYERLKMSLDRAVALAPDKPILAAIHYPPFTVRKENTKFADLLEKYPVKICVYGHLHGEKSFRYAFEGERNGINYMLLSCDYLNFKPRPVWPLINADEIKAC